jgi:hypothetical protein
VTSTQQGSVCTVCTVLVIFVWHGTLSRGSGDKYHTELPYWLFFGSEFDFGSVDQDLGKQIYLRNLEISLAENVLARELDSSPGVWRFLRGGLRRNIWKFYIKRNFLVNKNLYSLKSLPIRNWIQIRMHWIWIRIIGRVPTGVVQKQTNLSFCLCTSVTKF